MPAIRDGRWLHETGIALRTAPGVLPAAPVEVGHSRETSWRWLEAGMLPRLIATGSWLNHCGYTTTGTSRGVEGKLWARSVQRVGSPP